MPFLCKCGQPLEVSLTDINGVQHASGYCSFCGNSFCGEATSEPVKLVKCPECLADNKVSAKTENQRCSICGNPL